MTKRVFLGIAILGLLIGTVNVYTQGPAQGPGQGTGRSGRGGGKGPGGMRPGGDAGASDTSFFASDIQAKDEAEQKIFDVLKDMDKSRQGMMSVPMEDGRFLRILAESMGAQRVIEIGTSQGFSAIWFCVGLRKTGGKLTTFEIDEGRAKIAQENFKRAGVDGIVTLVLGDAHEKVKDLKGEIDILFLDADKDGYVDYLNKLLPLVRPGGLVIAHNINRQQADPKYLEAITKNPQLESLLVSLQAGGIGVSLKKR